MRSPESLKRVLQNKGGIAVLVMLMVLGLAWKTFGVKADIMDSVFSARAVDAILLGRLPPPVEPSITDPILDAMVPMKRYHLMTIRHIPAIKRKARMSHPYVGECRNCHLFVRGPKLGSQPKTPVGALLERLSRVHKLGPPLRPTSQLPHPPAGRCIKCHDIVVKVPVDKKKDGFLWNL
jgi:hypothetical protein